MPVYAEKDLVDGQKRWYIRTYVKDEFGNKKQITRHNKDWIGREGKKEAEWEEARLKNQTLSYINNNLTFDELFEKKLQYDEIHNKNSLSSRMTYRERIELHVYPHFKNKMAKKIGYNDCLCLVNKLKDSKSLNNNSKKKNLSINYINSIISVIIAVFEFGIDFYNLSDNPMKKVGKLHENKDKVIYTDPFQLLNSNITMSPSEWEKVASVLGDIIKESNYDIMTMKLALLLTVEYILLVRVGEVQGMKYKNLYFDLSIYFLCEAWSKKVKCLTPTKNRKSRILYIPNNLIQAFKNIYDLEKVKEDFSNDDFIFHSATNKNKPIPRSTIDRFRRYVLNRAQVRYSSNHQLRHAGISNAMYNEVDTSALSDMAGHNKEIMFNTYVQTLKEANIGLVNTLNEISIPHFNEINSKQDQK